MEFALTNKLYSHYPNNFVATKLITENGTVKLKLEVLLCAVCGSVAHPRVSAKVICPVKIVQPAALESGKCRACPHLIRFGDPISPLMGNFVHRDDVLALQLPVLMAKPPARSIVEKFSLNSCMADFVEKIFCTPGSKLIEMPAGGGKSTLLVAGARACDTRTVWILSHGRAIADDLNAKGVMAKTTDSLVMKTIFYEARGRLLCMQMADNSDEPPDSFAIDTNGDKYRAMLQILFPPADRTLQPNEKADSLYSAECLLLDKYIKSIIPLAINRCFGFICTAPPGAIRNHLSQAEQDTMFQNAHDVLSWHLLDDEYNMYETLIQPILEDKVLTSEQAEHVRVTYGEGSEREGRIKLMAHNVCVEIFHGALTVIETGRFRGELLTLLDAKGNKVALVAGAFTFAEAKYLFRKWNLQGCKFWLKALALDEYQQFTPLQFEIIQHLEYQSNCYRREQDPPTMVSACPDLLVLPFDTGSRA